MSSLRKPILGGLLAMAAALVGGCPAGSSIVFFNDSNLELAVRAQLSQPFGFITEADMRTLQVLDARGFAITNLEGLETATNLETLILTDNEVSDLRPLTNLTVLQSLELDNNNILDLNPLRGLLGLRTLSLCGNLVVNLGPLVTNATNGGLGATDQLIFDCQIENTDPAGIAQLEAANVELVCCDGGGQDS